jgi:catechol 2,3-dioxygenase-like lactoylglutathione lyase family enzyme
MDPLSQVRRFDHVGITVADLDTVTAFFVGLGLELSSRGRVPAGVIAALGVPFAGRALRC